ncbi:GNAT family N-acetyltransferase [Falsiruegeria litorea]|uniref:GNAT family N-acetyltransferase n=1 Tax=Falsiruegeria litorea TaxID=1280831 RepID=UPI001BFED8A7|nr:GNAT family N-acetyltransferase [Falsiruegeria litorea]MBT8169700.1 GNAT family N-acetyltransferase [Falsiruegeria litorea]
MSIFERVDGVSPARVSPLSKVIVIDDLKEILPLSEAYKSVQKRDPDSGVFLSWEWLFDIFSKNQGGWRLYAVQNSEAPTGYSGFFPVARTLHWSETKDELQTYYSAAGRLGLSDYVGFVCEPNFETSTIEALGKHLAKDPWARLSLRYEPTARRSRIFADVFEKNDDFSVTWPDYRINKGKTNQLVCPVLALPPDYETFVSGLGRRSRKQLKRYERRLAALEAPRFSVPKGEQVETDWDKLLELWGLKWDGQKSTGKVKALTAKYRDFLDRSHRLGKLFVVSLWDGEKMLGSMAHLVDRDTKTLHSVLEGRDPDCADLGVGTLLHHYAIRQSIRAKCTSYDFGHGDAEYKYRLGAEDVPVSYLTIRRRSSATGSVLDPSMCVQALQKVEKYMDADEGAKAKTSVSQLREALSRMRVSS